MFPHTINYGTIPRSYDRAKTYLFVKGWVDRAFEFELGRRTTTRHKDDVKKVLLLASLSNGYVEGCSDILNLCSGQTIRNHLKYQNPSKVLSVNTEIIEKMKSIGGALSKPVILAIDWHDEMYYGNPDDSDGIMGTQPKKGSHYAYRYATASVLIDGERLTIAVTPIVKDMSRLEHVKDLLKCVLFEHKIKVKLVLFDRGYYSADLVRYLNSLVGIDYIMQIPCHHDFKGGEDLIFLLLQVTRERRKSKQRLGWYSSQRRRRTRRTRW